VTDTRVLIEGHTDNVPIGLDLRTRFPSNWELSTAQATEVVRRLIQHGYIPPGQLQPAGRADTEPVASNDTEEGRRRNRRIEIILLPPAPARTAPARFLTGQPVYPGAGRSGRAARLERVDLPDAQSAEVVPTDLQPQHEPRLWAGRKEVGHALQMRWLVSVVERSRRLHDEGTLRAECSPTVTSISCVANWSTCSTGRSAPPFVLSSP